MNYKTLSDLDSLSDDDSFLSTLVNGYIDDVEKLIIDMENAISSRNYEGFNECAHALKGSSGSIGATALHMLCSEKINIESSGFCKISYGA